MEGEVIIAWEPTPTASLALSSAFPLALLVTGQFLSKCCRDSVGPLPNPQVAASFGRDGAGRPAATLLQPSHVWEPPSAARGKATSRVADPAPQDQVSHTRSSSFPPIQVTAALVLSDTGQYR